MSAANRVAMLHMFRVSARQPTESVLRKMCGSLVLQPACAKVAHTIESNLQVTGEWGVFVADILA